MIDLIVLLVQFVNLILPRQVEGCFLNHQVRIRIKMFVCLFVCFVDDIDGRTQEQEFVGFISNLS